MTIDLGFKTTRRERFRFYGINAPERGDEPGYSYAKTYIQELKARLDVGASSLYVRTHLDDRHDSFGRYLATLFEQPLGGPVECINTSMLTRGLAVVYVPR